LSEPGTGDRVEAEAFWVAFDPDKQSGPRCIEVLFFVAPGNGEHVWQCLDFTCGVTVAFQGREARMQALIERCCGLDVHQETVVACLLTGAAGTRARKEVRTFRTVRRELEALRDWLTAAGVTHVGMESTGVYWRPVYAVLEGHVELIVGNARHIRNVPGRKTDVKDAEWIADLVRHGLIAKSFVPPAPLRELRDLVRYRRKLIEAQAAERNRLLRLLETANIKLASVMSDVFGVSGRAMLKALIAGNAAPEEIAALARGQLRRKRAALIEALTGGIEEHHRFLLAMQLGRIEAIEADIAALDVRIGERLQPYSAEMALLMSIPGVNWLVGAVIIAEIGTDMSVFLSVHHLAAWAGVCPGSYESAGKQKSGRARKGNVHLRTILVGAAVSAARTKGSYLRDKFHRLKARRGALRAALAIAHKIVVAAYHMLARGVVYRDLGEAYLDQIGERRTVANLKRRLERLGYHVALEPRAEAA
jgi:transposase